MAEQEACTELVEKASQDQTNTTFEGESQLLPLLQGLLEAPDNEQTADSGTESGEDQRSGLIAEVQNALDKLSASLRDDTTDITPDRRTSLLQLVTKLQAGLAASIPPQERRSSVQGRFRRRQRPNRHTVGVSSEELADARRLIQEISLHDITPNSSKTSLLQKQNSEGSVGQSTSSGFKPYSHQKSVVKNAVAKPFSSSNSTVSGNSSSVHTPTESLDFLFNEDTTEKKPDFSYRSVSMDDQNISRSSSGDVSLKSVQQAVQQAAAIKVLTKSTENLMESEETDEDTTVKAQTIKQETTEPSQVLCSQPPDVVMQNNPIYNQQKSITEERNNAFYRQEKNNEMEEKFTKPNIKKLKMKRANTIDIPKPLNFYEEEYDSDCSLPEEDYNQRRRSNYLALRGPIRVGNSGNSKNVVPTFEPKTDNDKKFLAFINKYNENTSAKNSLWSKPEPSKTNIWNNKFGHIKTAFEKASTGQVQSQNSARQFWKTADDAVTSGPKIDGPKISKQSARNLKQMFEEKQKQSQKLPWSVTSSQNDKNIVTGSLKVKAFEPNEKSHKFVPQPLPVNKFSHAPQSAFKPLPKKPPTLEIPKNVTKSEIKEKDLDSPLFLYSPKPPQSESSLKPWITSPGESRVLSLAASKFENIPQQEAPPIKPRRMSKDKVSLPFQQQPPEKLTAPYIVKSIDQKNNNTVKQLSGQYDNPKSRNNDAYATYTSVKYTSHPEKMANYDQQQKHHYNQQPPVAQYNAQNQYSATPQNYYPQSQQYGHQNQQYQRPPSHPYMYQGEGRNYHPQDQSIYPNHNQTYSPQNEKYSSQHRQYNQQYEHQPYDNQNYLRNSHPPTVQHQRFENQNYAKRPQTPTVHNQTYGNQNYTKSSQTPAIPHQVYDDQSYIRNSQTPVQHQTYGNQNYAKSSQTPTLQYQAYDDESYMRNTPTPTVQHQGHGNQNYMKTSQTPTAQYQTYDQNYIKNSQTPTVQHQPYEDQNYRSPHTPTVKDYHSSNDSQQYNEPQYTSTYQYQPRIQTESPKYETRVQKPKEDYPEQKSPVKENNETKPPKLDSQVSVESLKEYNAVSSRVMTGPVSQQATTIRQKSPMSRDEHDMAAAFNLRNSLQKATQKSENQKLSPTRNETQSVNVSNNANTKNREEPQTVTSTNRRESADNTPPKNYPVQDEYRNRTSPSEKSSYKAVEPPKSNVSSSRNYSPKDEVQALTSNTSYKFRDEPQRIISPKSFSYAPREEVPKPISPHSFSYKTRADTQNSNYRYRNENRGVPVESLEINDHGESIVTSKFQIPVINIPQPDSPQPPSHAATINKAESWNQICLQNQQPLHKPSPRASPNARTISKSKSSHNLIVPKQFEAGMSKDEMAQKRRTMEAFLNGGNKSPQTLSRNSSNENLVNKSESKTVKRSINRLKTSEKISTCRQSTALSRSRTLPDIVCTDMLDETNVDKAFEDLFRSCS